MFLSTSSNEIGSHIQWKTNIYDTLHSAISMGMYSLQFFMGNPKGFTRASISDEDIKKSKLLNSEFPCNVFSHAPYLYNLCGSKNSLAWNGDADQDKKTKVVMNNLEYELKILSNFTEKTNGVIVHPGNYTDRQVGLLKIAETINMMTFAENSNLLLENAAGQGTSLCTTFKEIKTILDNIDEDRLKHVQVCLDTAHIYGYGEYNIEHLDEMIRMFQEFEDIIGIDKLKLIHLNDSSASFKSHKDRHELIGEGLIWSNNKDSLFYLLDYAKKHNIPLVLETTPTDIFKFN